VGVGGVVGYVPIFFLRGLDWSMRDYRPETGAPRDSFDGGGGKQRDVQGDS
jgi:hypothetical protein